MTADLRFYVERVTRIELAWPAWKAGALPLSYTRDTPSNASTMRRTSCHVSPTRCESDRPPVNSGSHVSTTPVERRPAIAGSRHGSGVRDSAAATTRRRGVRSKGSRTMKRVSPGTDSTSDVAAVAGGDDPVGDVEAQAGALADALGGEERLEDPLLQLFGDARDRCRRSRRARSRSLATCATVSRPTPFIAWIALSIRLVHTWLISAPYNGTGGRSWSKSLTTSISLSLLLSIIIVLFKSGVDVGAFERLPVHVRVLLGRTHEVVIRVTESVTSSISCSVSKVYASQSHHPVDQVVGGSVGDLLQELRRRTGSDEDRREIPRARVRRDPPATRRARPRARTPAEP